MRSKLPYLSLPTVKPLLHRLIACATLATVLGGGCSTMNLPADKVSMPRATSNNKKHSSEIRKTALADPFPSAADAGVQAEGD